jgi:hypothetical protein
MKNTPIKWILSDLLPIAIAISAVMFITTTENTVHAQAFPMLTDPGFNNPPNNAPIVYSLALSNAIYNTWGIESGAFVPFYRDPSVPFRLPIFPNEGNAMMRMDPVPGAVTQAIQLRNVSAPVFQTAIGSGLAFIDLSADFNVPRLAAGADGYVALRFYNTMSRARPANLISAVFASNNSLDQFRNSWQRINLNNVQVPTGTVRIDAEVGFNNFSLNNLVGLVDAAGMNLRIVPEPTSSSLLSGAIALAFGAFRKRKVG